jgi:hypothetical protein
VRFRNSACQAASTVLGQHKVQHGVTIVTSFKSIASIILVFVLFITSEGTQTWGDVITVPCLYQSEFLSF